MIGLLLDLLIILVVFALIFYVLQQFPVPEPFNKILRVVLVVVAVLFVLNALLGIAPGLRLIR